MKNVALKIAPKNHLWKNAVKSTSRQNHVKVREYFKSVHEVCKKIAQNIFGKFFRILVGDFPCERKKLLTLSKQKNEKLKEKKARRTTWVSQDAGLKAAPGRFSQVEDFFHARSSSLVVPHLAKPFPVILQFKIFLPNNLTAPPTSYKSPPPFPAP